jgi:hypothetical protein
MFVRVYNRHCVLETWACLRDPGDDVGVDLADKEVGDVEHAYSVTTVEQQCSNNVTTM